MNETTVKKTTLTGEIEGLNASITYEAEEGKAPQSISISLHKEGVYASANYNQSGKNFSFQVNGGTDLAFARKVSGIAISQIEEILKKYEDGI